MKIALNYAMKLTGDLSSLDYQKNWRSFETSDSRMRLNI